MSTERQGHKTPPSHPPGDEDGALSVTYDKAACVTYRRCRSLVTAVRECAPKWQFDQPVGIVPVPRELPFDWFRWRFELG